MLRLRASCGDRVNIDIEWQAREEIIQIHKASLLADLTTRRLQQVPVVRLHVTTRLQPAMEFTVKNQEQRAAVRVQHKRRSGEVTELALVPTKGVGL